VIKIEHISSHKGTHTPEQVGNDHADRLANRFRVLGETSKPSPYLLATEEALLFEHKHVIVQCDPRDYLKRLEKEIMKDLWKKKAPKQSEWVSKHPTQIMKQAKRVWIVETSQGKAWLYFVFAICQWLPTNHRMHYSKNDLSQRCNLCLTNSRDDMNHFLLCPS